MDEIDPPNPEGCVTGYPGTSYEDVEAEFVRELARRRKIGRFMLVSYILMGLFGVIVLAILLIERHLGIKHRWTPWFTLLNLVNAASWLVAALLKENAAKFIDSATDKRAIGPLLDMLGIHGQRYGYEKDTRDSAVKTLTRLLPEINEEDNTILNRVRRKVLASIMLKEKDGMFVLAAVEALSKTGRIESVRGVQDVMTGKAKYTGRDAQDAAKQALDNIQNRIEHDEAQGTLLRPSDSIPDSDPNLLRPADNVTSSDSTLLLHTSDDRS